MKKLFSLVTIVLIGLGTTYAQTTQPNTAANKTTTNQTANKSTMHMTKSGKPDMRYKENQKKDMNASSPAAVATGTKKKDGTLNMRYKANKGANKTTLKKS